LQHPAAGLRDFTTFDAGEVIAKPKGRRREAGSEKERGANVRADVQKLDSSHTVVHELALINEIYIYPKAHRPTWAERP
jgi:hypothetical protein